MDQKIDQEEMCGLKYIFIYLIRNFFFKPTF